MTMNNTWGFGKLDHNWKSETTLLHNLCDIASKGGNYLLNVGPTDLGEIPQPSVERLLKIGAWLKQNGEAIYGTRASIFNRMPSWGRTTTRRLPDGNTKIYCIVFETPKDGVLRLPAVTNKVLSTGLLSGDRKLQAVSRDRSLAVEMPAEMKDAKDYVVAITLEGKPVVDQTIRAEASGEFILEPRDAATTHGIQAQAGRVENLGSWTDSKGTITWTFKNDKPGRYDVRTRTSAQDQCAGSMIEFVCGDQVLPLEIKPTGSWDQYADASVGQLELPAGTVTLTVRCKTLHGIAPCNLAAVHLVPAK
jgi:alpha-L-fucosidase